MFTSPLRRCTTAVTAVAITATMVLLGGIVGVPSAGAAQPPVAMGTAAPFSVLGGQTVTNTGASVINGNLGLYPGTSITGFPPGVLNGVQHATDAVALQAQSDLTTAYDSAAGRTPVTVDPVLDNQNLVAGVYKAAAAQSLTGTLTLNGQNNTNAVFIFQAGSTLTTASNSTVQLINGAQWCNVYWQVGSSATLGTTTTFVGTVMALTSATLNTGANVTGRILARNGAVTLDTNTITQPVGCAASTTTSTTATPSGTNQGGGGGSGSNAKGTGVNGNGLGGGSNGNGLGGGVVPFGSPSTGFGGASHSGDPVLVAIGGVALMGAAVTIGLAYRRRRFLIGASGPDGIMSDGDG
jgi:hypothetical protein